MGAATSDTPARLGGIEVEERSGFDRVVLAFDGPLPDYRVAYGTPADPAEAEVLNIVLGHARAAGERELDPRLPAIGQVRRVPSSGETIRTVVTLVPGTRLPFRVGILLGAFYVDVAHPGEAVARPSGP